MSSSGRRAAAFAAGLAATLALTAAPVANNPLQRLAGGDGDGRDPPFDIPFTGVEELRLRGETHADTTYFVDAAGASPLAQGNAKAVGQLYFSRLLAVQDRRRARYVLTLRGRHLAFGPKR